MAELNGKREAASMCRIMARLPGTRNGAAACLATADPGERGDPLVAVIWMGALVLVILLAVAVVAFIRKRYRAPGWGAEPSFTLDELRRLRERGQVSDDEYEVLRRKALQGFSGEGQREP